MKQNIMISITLILLVGIIACSDTPYTGSMLTPADVDKYISYSGTGEICLENDGISKCLNLAQGNKRITIRIHPQRIVHTFYYEDTVILRAERQKSSDGLSGGGGANNGDRTQTDDDTGGGSDPDGRADGDGDTMEPPGQGSDDPTDNDPNGNGNTDDDDDTNGDDGNVGPPSPGPDDPTDNDPNGNGNTDDDDGNGNTDDDDDTNGDDGNVGPPSPGPDDPTDNNEIPDELKTHHAPNGWVVRLYYQDSIPVDAEASLEGSGFVVTVFDEHGNDITGTVKDEAFIGGEDGDGFQFFVPTTGQRIIIRVEGLIAEHVAIFIVNAQGEIVSTEGTHTYQINPL